VIVYNIDMNMMLHM